MEPKIRQGFLYDFYGELLNEHQKDIYEAYVLEDLSLKEIADEKGIHLNGVTQPLTVDQAYGFAGTVVYIDGFYPYSAYDLCCPHCLKRDMPCTINGMFAVCPVCCEEYDIYLGNGYPRKGISKEPLKEYRTIYNLGTGKLSVTRKQ